jgi:CBS domain-containing protein
MPYTRFHASHVRSRQKPRPADIAADRYGGRRGAANARAQRRLVGIFTGRDAVNRVLAEGKSAAATALADVMTPNPEYLTPGHSAVEALRLMQDARCRHLPIVAGGVVIGVVSRGDFRGLEQDRLDEETGLWERIG